MSRVIAHVIFTSILKFSLVIYKFLLQSWVKTNSRANQIWMFVFFNLLVILISSLLFDSPPIKAKEH